MDEPPNLPQNVPHKRGRPKGPGKRKGPSAQVVEPVKKKQPAPAPENNLCTQTKKKIPPRSPLPQRTHRNLHPGKVVMPRPKRTSAEVTEDKARKADLIRRLEELDKQRRIALAEMELDEEEEDIEEEETAIRHLNDLQDTTDIDEVPFAKDDGLATFQMDQDEPLVFPSSGEDESEDAKEDDGFRPKPVSV